MKLQTMGGLKLKGSDFQRAKALLLLAYLSLEGPQDRRRLAELFWFNSDKQLHNLTMTLSRLRKANAQLIQGDNIRVFTTVEVDAEKLYQAFQKNDIETVLALYEGPFLEGIATNNLGLELEEWLFAKREFYADLTRKTLLSYAKEQAKQKNFKQAAQQAAKAYQLRFAPEPEAEELEQLYAILQADKHFVAKEIQKEASAFGQALTLSQEEAQAALIRPSNESASRPNTIQAIFNLPIFTTAFVGRSSEISYLSTSLQQQESRLLSIIAQGGMGKTRLAVEVAQHLKEIFNDGICFASFVSARSEEEFIFTLADALNYSFLGNNEPKQQLLYFLKDKNLLLILDNLEHLLSCVSFIQELLLSAPQIKILVTSREALNLQAEFVFDLKGLGISEPTDPLLNHDSLTLFEQRAQMQKANFHLGEDNMQDVTTICNMLEGMPLAIELAASWLRVLPIREIKEELHENLDFLQAHNHDLPKRHQSMRAVFEYSWNLLTTEEQNALKKIAIFQGGFTRQAATEVTKVNLAMLANLINKSFLHATKSGRYRRHPLVIRYSKEKLESHINERQELEQKHGSHFLNYIRSHYNKLRTLERKSILDKLEPDLPNIRLAWGWAVKTLQLDELVLSAEAFSELFYSRSQEAIGLFDLLISALDDTNAKHHRALANALVYKTYHLQLLGNNDNSLAKKAELLFRNLDDKTGIVKCLFHTIHRREPDFNKEVFKEILPLVRRHGSPKDIGLLLFRYMVFRRNTGEFEEVKQEFQLVLAELKALTDQQSILLMQLCYGAYLSYCKHFAEGEKLLMSSFSMSITLNDLWIAATSATELGYAAFKQNHYQKAKGYFQNALQLTGNTGDAHFQTKSKIYLARIALKTGEPEEVKQNLHLSLQKWDYSHTLMETLVGISDYLISLGEHMEAVELIYFIQNHSYTEKRDFDQAQELLDALAPQLSEENKDQAYENSKTLRLEVVIEKALGYTGA